MNYTVKKIFTMVILVTTIGILLLTGIIIFAVKNYLGNKAQITKTSIKYHGIELNIDTDLTGWSFEKKENGLIEFLGTYNDDNEYLRYDKIIVGIDTKAKENDIESYLNEKVNMIVDSMSSGEYKLGDYGIDNKEKYEYVIGYVDYDTYNDKDEVEIGYSTRIMYIVNDDGKVYYVEIQTVDKNKLDKYISSIKIK